MAERSGLPVKTIRYYSDEGLIRPIGRSEGRYRLFSPSVFEELALIRSLKAMEIPLAEVGQILEVRRTGTCSCSALKGTIHSKREEIQRRIQELEGLQRELSQLLDAWQECGRAQP
ncbi:MAG: MerR family DNA-binding protein [Cyanobacteriota bacterium]